MAEKRSKTIYPIPANFESIQESEAFWDSHSLADDWDQTSEVEIEVDAPVTNGSQ